MAKMIILAHKNIEFADKETNDLVKLEELTCLEKLGEEMVLEKYYLNPKNLKGFEPDMVAPDPFETEYVVNADFEKGVDRKTNSPKLVLTEITRIQA